MVETTIEDKDKTIITTQIEGRVKSVITKKDEKGLVFLTINDSEGNKEVEFPYPENALGLDALQSVLNAKIVKYQRIYRYWCYTQMGIGSSNSYRLKVQEGALAGKLYEDKIVE